MTTVCIREMVTSSSFSMSPDFAAESGVEFDHGSVPFCILKESMADLLTTGTRVAIVWATKERSSMLAITRSCGFHTSACFRAPSLA